MPAVILAGVGCWSSSSKFGWPCAEDRPPRVRPPKQARAHRRWPCAAGARQSRAKLFPVPVSSRPFQVVSEFAPTGDQPAAIEKLSTDIIAGKPAVCLLGATGTG